MATAIMKQKGFPEMDDVEEIISKISEDSPYKRRPTQKRTWMTVPEMGKLLGLKSPPLRAASATSFILP